MRDYTNECGHVEVSEKQMKRWYKAIAEDTALYNESGRLMFDYEVADIMKEYVGFDFDVVIKSPYIVFKNVLLPVDVLAHFFYIEESKLTSVGEGAYILNCRDIVEATDKIDKDSYTKNLLKFIYDYGKDYEVVPNMEEIRAFDALCDEARALMDIESEVCLAIEDGVIAIAIDQYVDDAKETIGYRLGLSPKCFIEVSNPWSTVLLIDCKYISLSLECNETDDDVWLY